MVACQAADYYTTKRALDQGLEEGNPLLGKNNMRNVAIAKLVGITLFSLGGHFSPENRETIYQIRAGFGCGAAVWNDYQTKKYGD